MKVNWFHCNPTPFWLSFNEEIMKIARIVAPALVVALSAFLLAPASHAYRFFELVHEQQSKVDSLERAYIQAVAHRSTPKLEERKHLLRSFQRKGYSSVLAEVMRGDGFTALTLYLRTRLQIEYSISHELVMADISAWHGQPIQSDSLSNLLRSKPTVLLPARPREPMMIGLDIDWSFPEDPWKHE
jgi:hypothetical protein